jgi:Protein of unknown function (DUF3309)
VAVLETLKTLNAAFMNLTTIALIVLILLLIGALPAWSYSDDWGYSPSGGLGLVVVILIVLLLAGKI